MNEGKNNTVMLTIIGIATLLIAVVGATFAYFSAVVTGGETESTVIIQSGNTATEFVDGDKITVNDIYPRGTAGAFVDGDEWGTYEFNFSANGQDRNDYKVYLDVESASKFNQANEKLVATLTGTITNEPDGVTGNALVTGGSTITATINPTAGERTQLGDTGYIISDGTEQVKHSYTLKIYFPNLADTAQNTAQDGSLIAKLVIEDNIQ